MMANMTINGFDGVDALFKEISTKIDGIAFEAVNEAAPALEASMRSAISSAANKGYSQGELANSVGILPARKNQYGVFAVVKPIGAHSGGESNAKLASILEYGRRGGYTSKSGKKVTTQAPSPWRARAVSGAQAKCEATMKHIVEERLGCE